MDINRYQPKSKGGCKRNLLTLETISTEDIFEILHYARLLKARASVGERQHGLNGKFVALITKPSFARSRIAFEIAVKQLDGNAIAIPLGGLYIEDLKVNHDILPLFSRYGLDGIMIDTEEYKDAEALAAMKIPVINANSFESPCQALAMLLTVWEKCGGFIGRKVTFIGDFSRGENSLLLGAVKAGLDVSIACPEDFRPADELLKKTLPYGDINIFDSAETAAKDADAIYVSIGNPDFPYSDFTVNTEVMAHAKPNAIFLHPLPARRGEDVTDEVIDGAHSFAADVAENMLNIEKAALALIVGRTEY